MCARIVMRLFTTGYVRRLGRLGLKEKMEVMKLYVDDFNQIGYCLPVGAWYCNGKMFLPGLGWRGKFYSGCTLDKDRLAEVEARAMEQSTNMDQEARERNSAAIYRCIVNEVRPRSIVMKENILWNHEGRLLLVLDTKMGTTNGQVIHHHYTKNMSSL